MNTIEITRKIDTIKQKYYREIELSSAEDIERREECYFMLRALEQVKGELNRPQAVENKKPSMVT